MGTIVAIAQFALFIFLPLDIHQRGHLLLAATAAFSGIVQLFGIAGPRRSRRRDGQLPLGLGGACTRAPRRVRTRATPGRWNRYKVSYVPATPVYHFGLLVHDIEAAKARLSDVLGITFGETMSFRVDFERSGIAQPTEVVAVYSVEGPPFVELNQSQADGLLGRDLPEGMHHIGVWESSLAERLQSLKALGVQPEVVIRAADGTPIAAYLKPDCVLSIRVELVAHLPGFPGYTPELPGTGA